MGRAGEDESETQPPEGMEGKKVSSRNTFGRTITDSRLFTYVAGRVSERIARDFHRENRASDLLEVENYGEVTADELTLIGVRMTLDAFEQYMRGDIGLREFLKRAIKGLSVDLLDGARSRVEDGKYASDLGPYIDATSDRLREVGIVNILVEHLDENHGTEESVRLIALLLELRELMALPSLAKAYTESLGYTPRKETEEGTSVGRNLDLVRLAAMVKRGKIDQALRLARNMRAAAMRVTAKRLRIDKENEITVDKEGHMHRGPHRAHCIVNLMRELLPGGGGEWPNGVRRQYHILVPEPKKPSDRGLVDQVVARVLKIVPPTVSPTVMARVEELELPQSVAESVA